LYTIATHQAIDAMRRLGRHPTVSLDQATGESSEGELHSLIDLLESREVDPFEHTHADERRTLVRVAVDRLPDFLKQVVLLAYYQGLKYRDIAEILDIPVGTVKSRLHTALTKLHEAWSESPSISEL
jgi:RNA polymerase sigma-70 factor (ECF subfamily)